MRWEIWMAYDERAILKTGVTPMTTAKVTKIRVSFDIDVSKEHTIDGNPITADNALNWYQFAFDMYPDSMTEGFVTNMEAKVIT